ncbi:UNVERIFIED_CONTAM: SAG-related sequence SRS10 [Hammondia hammondi]|eukprot:XP_008888149.1 SAG-related sequence SRS10 [Hammondia hammondi]
MFFLCVAAVDDADMHRHGSFLVPGVCAAAGLGARPDTGESAHSICHGEGDNVTVCTCVDSKGENIQRAGESEEAPVVSIKTADLVFSGQTNKLTLICEGAHVPDNSVNGADKVCHRGADIDKCAEGASIPSNASISIKQLLTGEKAESIKWLANPDHENNKSYSLTISGNNLPLTDKAFSVGCLNKGNTSKAACKVTVTLAKVSQTTGNTVECAYGANSNASRQQVTLSPTQNSLILICGKDSAILPTKYKKNFCPTGTEAEASCAETYKSIIPQYEESWWSESTSATGTYKLEIPTDKFPEKGQKIVIGCKDAQSPGQTHRDAGDAASGKSICNVDVTIAGNTGGTSDVAIPSPTRMTVSAVVVLGVGFLFLN